VSRGPTATVVTLDARQARYGAGDIQTVSPGVEQYVFGGRAWISGRWINTFDEDGNHQWGWLGRADVIANDAIRLFAGVADAPDVSEGVVTDTFSLFAGVSAAIGQRTTIRLSVAHEDRATGTDRSQIGMGLGIRF
jgi:YaiO family outer membrane protein